MSAGTPSPTAERLLALPWVSEVTVRRPCDGIRWSLVPMSGPIPAAAHCSRRARLRYEATEEAQRTDGAVTGHYCLTHAQVVALGGNVERARIEKLERQRAAAAHARASKRRKAMTSVPTDPPAEQRAPEPATATA
jgi:hypothetical protein